MVIVVVVVVVTVTVVVAAVIVAVAVAAVVVVLAVVAAALKQLRHTLLPNDHWRLPNLEKNQEEEMRLAPPLQLIEAVQREPVHLIYLKR